MKLPCPNCSKGVIYSTFQVPACKDCQRKCYGFPAASVQVAQEQPANGPKRSSFSEEMHRLAEGW